MTTPAQIEWKPYATATPDASQPAERRRERKHPAVRLLPTLLFLALACGACGGAAYAGAMEAGVALFVVLIFTLALVRPGLVFTLALLLAPFPNDVSVGLPVKVAASDLCLFLAVPFVASRRFSHFTRALRVPYWIPVTAYLGLCVGSTVLNGFDRDALVSTSQMFIYMVFTVLMFAAGMGRATDILPRLYTVTLIATVIAVAIVLGGSNFVFGLHKNSAGSTLGAAVVITLGLLFHEAETGGVRRLTLVLLVVLATGLLASLSRGAWIGAGTGAVLITLLYGRVGIAIRLGICCVPFMAALWLLLPENQREYATDLSANAYNVQARFLMIDYAMNRFRESPLIGVGVGLRKTYDATNVALSTLAETGLLGLLSFGAVYATLGLMTFSAARRLDRRDPAFALLAMGIALVLAKLLHGLVDHYWSRGAILFWAGAGFVILSYLASRKPHVKADGPPTIVRAVQQ